MKVNEQFSVAIHILVYLDKTKQEYVSSSEIAKSINTNPVVVRRILGKLKTVGIIEVRRGSVGSRMIKNPNDITLLQIYQTVEQNSLFKLHENTSIDCQIGRQINDVITNVLDQSVQAMYQKMATQKLSLITNKIRIIGELWK